MQMWFINRNIRICWNFNALNIYNKPCNFALQMLSWLKLVYAIILSELFLITQTCCKRMKIFWKIDKLCNYDLWFSMTNSGIGFCVVGFATLDSSSRTIFQHFGQSWDNVQLLGGIIWLYLQIHITHFVVCTEVSQLQDLVIFGYIS